MDSLRSEFYVTVYILIRDKVLVAFIENLLYVNSNFGFLEIKNKYYCINTTNIIQFFLR